jgi:PhzF family phenazine biosynthesis protein
MNLKIYVANAFSKKKFAGNPAAVVPLNDWLDDSLMQQVAAQNNLAETAYIIPEGTDYHIRWFTPSVEVDLCGHATLASAHIMFEHLGYNGKRIVFNSKSGPLHVLRDKDKITLDFPVDEPEEVRDEGLIEKALGKKPTAVYISRFDYLVVLEKQSDIEDLQPDLSLVKNLKARGLIVTAKGNEADFVSRCFFPQSGINEDPVTGSAHCVLTPYWTKQTGKSKLNAIQLSERRGWLECELAGDRVLISGYANTYLAGDIFI